MADDSNNALSARDLVWGLIGAGWSRAAIARKLGRDPRLIRFVADGTKPGNNLVAPLQEMLATGEVSTQPARRVGADGRAAKIRSKGSRKSIRPPTPTPSKPPATPRRPKPSTQKAPPVRTGPAEKKAAKKAAKRKTRSIEQPRPTYRDMAGKKNRYKLESTRSTDGERERHEIIVPRSAGAWNRWQGSDDIKDILGDAAGRGKRFDGFLSVEFGPPGAREKRDIRLGGKGGYDCEGALSQIRADGGNVFEWLHGQVYDHAYLEDLEGDFTVVGMDLNIW